MKMKTQLSKICRMQQKQCLKGNSCPTKWAWDKYIKKEGIGKDNNLSFHLRKEEKEEQHEPKASGGRGGGGNKN